MNAAMSVNSETNAACRNCAAPMGAEKILRAMLATVLAQAAITFLVYMFMLATMRLAPH